MPLPGVVSVWTRACAGGWRGRRGRAGGKQAAWEDPAQAEIDSSASAGRFRARAGARAGKGAGRNGRRRPQAPPEGAPGVENVPGHALVVAAPLAHARPGDLRRKPGRRLHGCGHGVRLRAAGHRRVALRRPFFREPLGALPGLLLSPRPRQAARLAPRRDPPSVACAGPRPGGISARAPRARAPRVCLLPACAPPG